MTSIDNQDSDDELYDKLDYDEALDQKVQDIMKEAVSLKEVLTDNTTAEPASKRAKTEDKPQKGGLWGFFDFNSRPPSPAPNNTDAAVQSPGPDMTGVDVQVTRMAVTLSDQIYAVENLKDFNLSTGDFKAEAILYDNELIVAKPPMAIAVTDKTMMIGFRGTQTLMDTIMDAAFSPLKSRSFSHIAPSVHVQGGFNALVEGYLGKYEDYILTEIENRKIEELIFTGHSLGGAISQVFHVCIAGELQKKDSKWFELKDKLKLRTITIAAPMSILDIDGGKDQASKDFLKSVGRNTCNIVYGQDIVPHGYGSLTFAIAVLKAAIPEVIDDLQLPGIIKFLGGLTQKALDFGEDFLISNKELLCLMAKYRHLGKIIYYKDATSSPVVFWDPELNCKKKEGSSVKLFRDLVFEQPKKGEIVKTLGDHHGFLRRELAYNHLK